MYAFRGIYIPKLLHIWYDVLRRAAEAAGNADVAEVLRRSESIYRQAAGNYNETLHRPWIYIPGRLMGFHYEEAAKVPGRVHI